MHNQFLSIFSEIGELKRVLLHRPGSELDSLTPKYLDAMLFEDIPFLERMQEEHDSFAAELRSQGCEVLYVEELLRETVGNAAVAKSLIDKTIALAGIPDTHLTESLKERFLSFKPAELARHLISGIRKEEIDEENSSFQSNLSSFIRDDYPFYINPLPNLYFTRDPGSVIGNSCSINTMQTAARKRETLLLSAILKNNPRMVAEGIGEHLLEGYTGGSSIEGGDILVLSHDTVAVGCSARTETWAIEELAKRILHTEETAGDLSNRKFSRVLVIQIPFTRAYMHLDTVFTMVDYDKFTIYPGVEPALKVFSITRGASDGLSICVEEGLSTALKKSLNLGAVDLIKTGGGDRITAAREQWNDSANTLATAPGVVVTYRRNVVSNDTLTKHGITVHPIQGSELVRGRGGPRCMSMPLLRAEKRISSGLL